LAGWRKLLVVASPTGTLALAFRDALMLFRPGEKVKRWFSTQATRPWITLPWAVTGEEYRNIEIAL
jgi:hypothetical protein